VKREAIREGATGAPYSPAIVVGDMVFTAGQVGLDPETKTLAVGFENEVRQAMENLKSVLKHAGSDLDLAVKITIYVTDMSRFAALNEIYKTYFTGDPPARTCVEVSALPFGAQVEVDAVAVPG
jgi:2-iminobutanoate/2-iminopropanoate deaminase